MLLHGPPGTGKTLIARKISDALNCTEPKVINGPEIFDKFVGEAERKVRELFEPAEKEQKEKGEDSDLHVIIFDEIDAICKTRGSTGSSTGVNESVVNQLLSKMDGVNQLNNILIIGMTNRKDMMDEAILRPGRLEIHLEIGLPDLHGRVQIFNIHTRKAKSHDLLDSSVDIQKLAELTKNYTGAEIEAVCRSATSFALFKEVGGDPNAPVLASGMAIDPTKKMKKGLALNKVFMSDFMRALEENKPAFGIDNSGLDNRIRGGIYNYGSNFETLKTNCNSFINQVRTSQNQHLLTLLLEGEKGCGKTALAAKLALESDFPYVKMISPENFVGYTEVAKVHKIVKMFEDAYKSDLSLIILDEIERIMEYIDIGPRFS